MGTHRGMQAVSRASNDGHQCLMLRQVLLNMQALKGSADKIRLLASCTSTSSALGTLAKGVNIGKRSKILFKEINITNNQQQPHR